MSTLRHGGPTKVYVIRAGNLAKIGCTNDTARRLKEIRNGRGVRAPFGADLPGAVLVAEVYGDEWLEGCVHDAFVDLSIGHEWFRWDDRLAAWCKLRTIRRTNRSAHPEAAGYWPPAPPRRVRGAARAERGPKT